ncbi:Integrase, catalytic core,Ribonuclease H-like domain [Cinara cedri]|uniref:Integrase, catalytic core,Ribonuclease H-like domain n=1 Tax=Cinara cedri TaxID=506608 RepID=A0A5E4N3A8_9HEMI|nr:Integrase, catalytic core,Ribonuclease H-like domain [Cinara cedri]
MQSKTLQVSSALVPKFKLICDYPENRNIIKQHVTDRVHFHFDQNKNLSSLSSSNLETNNEDDFSVFSMIKSQKDFNRRIVNVYGKNDLWQADLIQMIPYSKKNKGYEYILCVIDCFTKYAWALPLKSKTAKEVTNAMSTILIKRSPQLLQLDNGKEFYNSTFDTVMKKDNVKKYSTYSTTKACIVERFNCTLKEKMFREFTAKGNHNWLSILSMLINEYYNSKHRTIGMTPLEADNNPGIVRIKRDNIPVRKIKFKVGDSVRISTHKGVFTKGYLPNWSTEVFTIVRINKKTPTTYILEDYTSKSIAGCFYAEEINKTEFPNTYLIEKNIEYRTVYTNQNTTFTTVCGGVYRTEKRKIDYKSDTYRYFNQIRCVRKTCLTMYSAILDMQCVLRSDNKYLIKEMSIVDTNTSQNGKSRKTNKWLERNFNNIPVEYGDNLSRKSTLIDIINMEIMECPRLNQLCHDENLPCCIFHIDLNLKHENM